MECRLNRLGVEHNIECEPLNLLFYLSTFEKFSCHSRVGKEEKRLNRLIFLFFFLNLFNYKSYIYEFKLLGNYCPFAHRLV